MPENARNPISDGIRSALAELCADGPVSYRDYIATALYHPAHGYYLRQRKRVGRALDRDFYTAESLGTVFSRLVVAAAEKLIGPAVSGSVFVEIAAEPGSALLDPPTSHPFAATRVIRPGGSHAVEGPAVVFANEWLDALPFHRLVFHDGRWRERGVSFENDGLAEVLLPEMTAPLRAVAGRLPERASEGYQLDLPLAAEAALRDLLDGGWSGLLLLFDYGRTWGVLASELPQGSARRYRRHRTDGNLLAAPGDSDITCDLCWDFLQSALRDAGFASSGLESQEAFLVKHGAAAAEAIVTQAGGAFSRERQTLMELIHPAHMGRRFQVLWGLREAG